MSHIHFLPCLGSVDCNAQCNGGSSGFIDNKGQIHDQNGTVNSDVIARCEINGLDVLLCRNGFSLQLNEVSRLGSIMGSTELDGMCGVYLVHSSSSWLGMATLV